VQELADEAFADLLKKHGIPIDLKDALKRVPRSQRMLRSRRKRNPRPEKHREEAIMTKDPDPFEGERAAPKAFLPKPIPIPTAVSSTVLWAAGQ
jgi:hypothetical protein